MPNTAATQSPQKVIRAPEFARRFEQAADRDPHCPAKHHGRLGWIAQEMLKRGHRVSNETVRKWFDGEAKPRPEKGEALAEILKVQPEWLQMGIDATATPRERKARNAMASGVVNLVAGLVQMDGGVPSFPAEGDARAKREHIDMYAIIKAGHYDLHVTLGEPEDRKARFVVPTDIGENVIVIGVIRDGLTFDLFEISPEIIAEHGDRKGGSIEVTVDGSKLRRIPGFTARL